MIEGPLRDLGVTNPVLAAPMAGGPSTPDLVRAAFAAGSIGFVAAGYKAPELLLDQMTSLRVRSVPFGVNLFAPNPLPVDPTAFGLYARLIQREADAYGLDATPQNPVEDDDDWQAKIDLLVDRPVPLVGFTFAVPGKSEIDALHRVGSTLIQTVTSVDEARIAREAGMDMLAVQSFEAGGHWGTFTPRMPPPLVPTVDLVNRIRAVVDLPILAAGGIATPSAVSSALQAGAMAVLVGTVLLRTNESGASDTYKGALGDMAEKGTLVTLAFTGRPARAIPNAFTETHDEHAPFGYPAIHHLTAPIRRAAAAAGDHERINIWAGTGHAQVRAEPATETLTRLAERI